MRYRNFSGLNNTHDNKGEEAIDGCLPEDPPPTEQLGDEGGES